MLRTVRLCLEHFDYVVETCLGGTQALAKLGEQSFDLVITDRKMSGMDGCELASRIKAQWPHLPVLMLTAFPPEPKPDWVDSVLLKPFSIDSLESAVDSLLTRL